MKHLRTVVLAVMLLGLPVLSAGPAAPPAQATPTPLKLLFYQGDLTSWVNSAGVVAVANTFASADVLVLSHAGAHNYGGSEWPNLAYGARGCISMNHRPALLQVLAAVRSINQNLGHTEKIFGYVSGGADAPDEGSKQSLCGNNVINFESQFVPAVDTATNFTACPGGVCANTVYWVNEWLDNRDSLHTYIDGIFFDYVTADKMSTSVRDNIYNYVKAGYGKLVMANSLVPGSPCSGCTGNVNNYEFAANSTQLTSSDFILVEGYYAKGITGNCSGPKSSQYGYAVWCDNRDGVATLDPTQTSNIATVRNTVANARGYKVHLAALISEPPDAAFNSLSCSWSDYTTGKSYWNATAITGDALGFQFSDLGTLDTDGNGPDRTLNVC